MFLLLLPPSFQPAPAQRFRPFSCANGWRRSFDWHPLCAQVQVTLPPAEPPGPNAWARHDLTPGLQRVLVPRHEDGGSCRRHRDGHHDRRAGACQRPQPQLAAEHQPIAAASYLRSPTAPGMASRSSVYGTAGRAPVAYPCRGGRALARATFVPHLRSSGLQSSCSI